MCSLSLSISQPCQAANGWRSLKKSLLHSFLHYWSVRAEGPRTLMHVLGPVCLCLYPSRAAVNLGCMVGRHSICLMPPVAKQHIWPHWWRDACGNVGVRLKWVSGWTWLICVTRDVQPGYYYRWHNATRGKKNPSGTQNEFHLLVESCFPAWRPEVWGSCSLCWVPGFQRRPRTSVIVWRTASLAVKDIKAH